MGADHLSQGKAPTDMEAPVIQEQVEELAVQNPRHQATITISNIIE
jgi:hypothetical protein